MKLTISDKNDGSEFGLDLGDGTPTAGSLLVTEAPDGTDRRIYVVLEVRGTTLIVERQPISFGTYA
jgi:hypothetical protein